MPDLTKLTEQELNDKADILALEIGECEDEIRMMQSDLDAIEKELRSR